MCGIAGVLGRTNHQSCEVVGRMLRAMTHRGPDQNGMWKSEAPGAVFGHRRLSIIDLSEAGRQPMVDESTGVSLTYNGECYNFKALRVELESAGHTFRSMSDSEVILKAYLAWGDMFVTRLRGMFALAIWDPRSRETILVRDRIGIKPLYYTMFEGRLLFASEVRALLAAGVDRKLDTAAVASYLWHGFVPGPDTIVSGIKRLDPATLLRVDVNGVIREQRRYWQLNAERQSQSGTQALERCHAELARATDEHLASDVPLGVFLSGGVDSSAIAALAQRSSTHAVTTYNIRFDEAEYDESKYARQVADRLGTNHRELTLTETTFRDQLDDAINSLDQPTFDAINTYFVSRAVKEAGLTVALAGTGGDELFGGYSSFKDLRTAATFTRSLATLPKPLRGGLVKLATSLVSRNCGEVRPQVRWGKIADLIESRGNLLALYQVSYSLFTRDFQNALMCAPHEPRVWGLAPEQAAMLNDAINGEQGVLEKISTLEIASFLGQRLLPDTDSASMAVSLEVRVPFLDHQFVESLHALDSAQRYEPLGRKAFLRNAVSQELDPALFDRPKAGFELPMERWCRNSLTEEIDETFRDINLAHSIGLDAETLSRLWRAYKDGAPGLYWTRIWSIYILMNWCRRYGVSIA